jgi:GT2 family glycosyltransferase
VTSRVTAVVITRNHAPQVGACLDSVLASTRAPDEILVLDHASSDGTAHRVRGTHPGVLVLDYRDNPGFGVGVNRARRVARGDALLLINPDARVEPDCIERLTVVLDTDTAVAAVGPKVLLPDDAARIASAGLRVNRIGYACDRGYLEPDRGQYDAREDRLGVSGCVLLVRARAFDEVGGFDPAYFLYYEDLDLCWRLWLAGHRVVYEPAAVAYHRPAADTTGVLRHDHDHRNRLRTLVKNCGAATLLEIALPVAWFEVSCLAALAARGRPSPFAWRLRAQLATIARLGSALRLRRSIQRARRTPESRMVAFLAPGYGNPPPPPAIDVAAPGTATGTPPLAG